MDDLIKYRLSTAQEKLTSAKLLLDAQEQYERAKEILAVIEEYVKCAIPL